MQGLADGYFVLPYTIQNYLARPDHCSSFLYRPAWICKQKGCSGQDWPPDEHQGKKSVDSIHKELGRVMWEYVGMGRTAEGLKKVG